VEVFVVRHAKAGSRGKWQGPDEDRPLTKSGQRQAAAIGGLLDRVGATRVLSSPYRRCIETVEPLARGLGLDVEPDHRLEEGADWTPVLDLAVGATGPLVLCSHGDVIGDLMYRLAARGVPVDDDRIEKGSIWVLQVEDGEVVKARYQPPPES
jgi:8-oxo-dGTP diphosphatase